MADKIELLAPAGTWDVLEKVAEAGADAVYVGGKKFNMRMLKGNYNFTDEEIKTAVRFLHDQNKKLYITINNLYFENEIHELKDYLLFLEDAGVDALIAQDLGVADIYRELKLTVPIHASVQMGIGNSEAVKFLEKQGFTRVILSKNLSLEEIKEIRQATTMGIEIFAHGDLCISHTGQCYMSSFMAGASGNRGRCIKPCRWQYKLSHLGAPGYYLAHNDLSLYPFLPQLIDAGLSSLKIEGRMRSADYLATIINLYRQALDNIYQNQEKYQINQEHLAQLESLKVRNLTAAGLEGKLAIDAVDITGTREPIFPTKPRKLKIITREDYYDEEVILKPKNAELTVKIGNLKAIPVIKDYCDTIIAGLEQFPADNSGFSLNDIIELLKTVKPTGLKVKIETPRIVTQKNWPEIASLTALKGYDNLAGFIVNDLGSLYYLSQAGFPVWGGPGLNISNSKANDLLSYEDVLGLCLSPELKLENLKAMPTYQKNWEIIIHGPLTGIITDYPFAEAYPAVDDEDRSLMDEFDQSYRMRMDRNGRTHIYYPYDLCLYSYLPALLDLDITRMRIDGQFYNNDILAKLTVLYHERLQAIKTGLPINNNWADLLQLFEGELTDLSFSRANI